MNNDQLKAIEEMMKSYFDGDFMDSSVFRHALTAFAKQIAALTAAQSGNSASLAKVQEPVGEMKESAVLEGLIVPVVTSELPVGTKLYATPQAQQEAKPEQPHDFQSYMNALMCSGNKAVKQAAHTILDWYQGVDVSEQQEAGKDVERLNFLIAEECQVWEINGRYAIHAVTEHHPMTGEYSTARAAIDAAMKASTAQATTAQELDNVLQELVDIAQEEDMGYGPSTAQADDPSKDAWITPQVEKHLVSQFEAGRKVGWNAAMDEVQAAARAEQSNPVVKDSLMTEQSKGGEG